MKVTTRARPRRWRALVGSAVAVVLVATLSPANPAAAAIPLPDDGGGSKLTAALTTRFDRAAGAPQDFVIRFGTRADLSTAPGIKDWVARGEYVVKELQRVAAKEQAPVTDLLKQQRVTYRSFWISNTIHVTGGSRALAEQLAARPEVAQLLEPVVLARPNPRITVEADNPIRTQAVEWGLQNIHADDVWAQGVEGSGIVIANIDTGVQFDHPTLVNQYRGNVGNGAFNHDYNWFDVSGHCTGAPCDTNGHGTHTMGTMIGDDGGANQIGVAPGARWITANGCDTCTTEDLLASAQWMLAPTRVDGSDPDPAMRPHIVNNSWGTTSPSSAPYMTEVWLAWEASGIFGVFANGNSGSGCRTSGAPGSNLVTYSVGAYDSTNTIAPFSARGPGQDGTVKPDIAAPGVAVRSAYFGNRMGTASGTSMAAPHVSGAVGLLWSAAPELVGNIQATRDLLDLTAVDTPDDQCGGSPGNNNVFGEGRVDVQALVRGRQVGTLAGRVTNQTTGEAVPNAQVRIVGGPGDLPIDRTVVANADGHFRSGLPAGDYEITGSAYSYLPSSARVSITNGATTTQDLALGRAPTTVVTGQLTDGSGHGWPLYSVVTVGGYPGGPVYTDPVNGRFEVTLPAEADYTFTIDPVYPGYQTTTETVHVTGDRTTFDHAVPADLTTCTAPGYGWNGQVTTFDGWTAATPQDGWQISGRQGSWRFDNPAGRTQPPGSLGAFPIADPAANQRGTVDSTLTSPAFDLTGHTAPELLLDMRYLGAPRSQEGRIEYSTDGRRWTRIWSATTANVVGQVSIPLPEVAGQDSVRFRFVFTGRSGTHYWAFDNLFVGTRRCVARDGGLVVGEVYDQASGDGLVNTKVGLTSLPGTYVWSQWNVDPTRVGSPYWLFAPGNGPDQLWAEAVGRQRYVADVTVTPHRLTHHDIRLTAAAATNRNGS